MAESKIHQRVFAFEILFGVRGVVLGGEGEGTADFGFANALGGLRDAFPFETGFFKAEVEN